MNLYLVTCVCVIMDRVTESQDVYVIAPDEKAAAEKGLALMRELDYKYQDRVDSVRLIASRQIYKAAHLLAM